MVWFVKLFRNKSLYHAEFTCLIQNRYDIDDFLFLFQCPSITNITYAERPNDSFCRADLLE